jgi:hypothetical protein
MRIIVLAMLLTVSAFAQTSPAAATAACVPENVTLKLKLDESQHALSQPEPGKALVYFIQEKGSDTFAVTTGIGLDGAGAGSKQEQFLFRRVRGPGGAPRVCEHAVLSGTCRRARAFHGGSRPCLLLQCASHLRRRSQAVLFSQRGRQRPGQVSDCLLTGISSVPAGSNRVPLPMTLRPHSGQTHTSARPTRWVPSIAPSPLPPERKALQSAGGNALQSPVAAASS